jgi:chromate transporter
MAAVALKLAWATLFNWHSWLIATAALAASVRFRVSAPWLVAGGALAGAILQRWA